MYRPLNVVLLVTAGLSAQLVAPGSTSAGNFTNSDGSTVHYQGAGGEIVTTSDVPGGSTFSRTGGGGVVQPCGEYGYTIYHPDPGHPALVLPLEQRTPEAREPHYTTRVSKSWDFDEVLNTTPVDDERLLKKMLTIDYDIQSWFQYLDATEPLDELNRRFSVSCKYTPNSNSGAFQNTDYIETIDVPITDAFFGVAETIQRLRAGIQLEPIEIKTTPDRSTWGGLVVNMPTHLAIDTTPWYIHEASDTSITGVTLTQTVAPRSLEYQVTFTPKGGGGSTTVSVPCLTTTRPSAPGSGRMPRVDADIPEFAVEDPGLPCVWLPTERGTATIRALIVYDVSIHYRGRTRSEAPYLWTSEPYTVPVGELRVVNVNGDE